MNQIVSWFAKNPVAANLVMIVLFVGGGVTIFTVKQEVFPEFSLDMITVTVPYPGAAPEEVEEAICVRVEEEIDGLDGIKKVTSTASENVGMVMIQLFPGTDGRELLNDVKARVDAIDTFPIEAEQPLIEEVTNRQQVINVAVSGNTEERTLKELGKQVRDEISALNGVSLVELANTRPYEVSIEVSEQALRRHGISFDAVTQAVRQSSMDLPGGSLRTAGGEILLRTKGQAYSGIDFEEIPLVSRRDGTRLVVGDVARVVDGFAETDIFGRFDGELSVQVQVYRVGKQGAIRVANTVKDYVVEAQHRMPDGITLTTWQDTSRILQGRMDLLIRNGRMGLFLVFLMLALFLRFRLSFWVTLGIPISFAGALWLMPPLDVSINLISLFAFIVVLGIVVDDAIVVGENIFTHQKKHGNGMKGAIEGAQEVAVPVVFAVLTTIAAFAPMTQVQGMTGKIMRVIPMIVIPTLVFSLVESLLILPAHLTHMKHSRREDERKTGNFVSKGWKRFQSMFSDGLEWFIGRVYRPSLELALRHRYSTVAIGIATLLLTAGLVGGGWIRFTFFPPVEADYVSAALTMPQGTPAEVTAAAVQRIEESAMELGIELEGTVKEGGEAPFQHITSSIGQQPLSQSRRNDGGMGSAPSAGHLGEVAVELAPSEARSVTSQEIVQRWREKTGAIPDAVELTFNASIFSPGDAIDVQLSGPDLVKLREAAQALKTKLAEYPGVFDVADTFREGKREIQLRIKPEAEALGLTQSDLARQVRHGFYGAEVQNVQRGRDEVKVFVRYPQEQRQSIGDLENMRVRTPAGAEVPFSLVAEADFGRGYESIKRVDRKRSVNVTADVDDDRTNANEVLRDLQAGFLPRLQADYRVHYSFEGQAAEQRETMAGLRRGFAIALFVIYALMAIPFRSYVQPLIVMSAIPFGLVGAIWGHVIMGMNLTILSMFGIVALTGVVVNDSLVMVDKVNRLRREGETMFLAVREAGAARFRPILLTSLTTFVGLTPLLLEKSVQAKFLVPMAVSLAFGVIFATFITLVIVPSGYLILEDLKRGSMRIFRAISPRKTEEVTVAEGNV